jgi:hypothetical protein
MLMPKAPPYPLILSEDQGRGPAAMQPYQKHLSNRMSVKFNVPLMHLINRPDPC